MSDCNQCTTTTEVESSCPDPIVCAPYVEARDSNCVERMIEAVNSSVLAARDGKWRATTGSVDNPLFLLLQEIASAGGIVGITPEGLVGQIVGKDGDTLINIGGVWTAVQPGTLQLCFNNDQISGDTSGHIAIFACGPEGKLCLRKYTKPNCYVKTDADGKIVCGELKNCLDDTNEVAAGDVAIVGVVNADGEYCFKYIPIPTDASKCYELVINDDKDIVVRERLGSIRWQGAVPVTPVAIMNETYTANATATKSCDLSGYISALGKCPKGAMINFEILNRGASRVISYFDVSCQGIKIMYQYNYWFQSSSVPTKNYANAIVPINSDGTIDVETIISGSQYATGGYVKAWFLGFVY